jgi:hypothetical protein
MIHDTHYRLHQLTLRYGDMEEQREAHEILSVMESMVETIDGSSFERLGEVKLPGFLARRCAEIARARQGRSRRFSLQNQHGVQRTLEDEIRSAEAQYACCLILDLPFNHRITESEARARGNLGGGISAFCPRPGRFSLLVGEKEPDARRMVLMLEKGPHQYELRGWIRAGEAKQEKFQVEFHRDGVVSKPYVVPAEFLATLAAWRP